MKQWLSLFNSSTGRVVGFDYVVTMGMSIDFLTNKLLQEVRHGATRPVQGSP